MKAKLIKDRLFLKKIADNYTLHRIKDGILTIEGDSHYTIKGIHPFYKLSLKNCQAIERGYDLDELAHHNSLSYTWLEFNERDKTLISKYGIEAFKAGFQKCLELMGDKKFSEEDVRRSFSAGLSIGYGRQFEIENRLLEIDYYMQSLQQTEWDVEIEMQKVKDETKIVGAVKGVKGSGSKITTYKSVPKLDADGCLILKRI